MKATSAKRLTFEEYLAGPETNLRYDIVDGEMIMAPSPLDVHQRILTKLLVQLHAFVSSRGLGEVLPAPLDVIISRDPLQIRQPDILFVRKERSEIFRGQVHGAPDLAIEILSPSESRSMQLDKLSDYAKLGVQECWIVSPEAVTVEVLTLTKDRYQRTGLFGLGDKVKSPLFSELDLLVDQIF